MPFDGHNLSFFRINILKEVLKYNNEELLNGIREKDNTVLQYIIKQNYKSVRHIVTTNSGQESDSQDVLQETIIVLFRKVNDDNFKLTSSLSTLVYSIARLIWLKELEKRKNQVSLSTEQVSVIDDEQNIELTIEKNDRLRLYRDKFEELGEDCKKVLRLFYLGTPVKQITKFMGYVSDEYTRKKKYSCKNTLVNTIKSSKQYKELGYDIK